MKAICLCASIALSLLIVDLAQAGHGKLFGRRRAARSGCAGVSSCAGVSNYSSCAGVQQKVYVESDTITPVPVQKHEVAPQVQKSSVQYRQTSVTYNNSSRRGFRGPLRGLCGKLGLGCH